MEGIEGATTEELAAEIGKSKALLIKEYFKKRE